MTLKSHHDRFTDMTETSTLTATTYRFAYAHVGGSRTAKSEFEIHGPDCAHLPKITRDMGDWSIQSAASPEALIEAEVDYFADTGQGWAASDFRVMPCARKAMKAMKAAAPVVEAPEVEETDEVTPEVAQAELDRRVANRKAKKAGKGERIEPASEAAFEMSKDDLRAIIAG